MSSTYDERMALRNRVTMAQCQQAFDDLAEPDGTEADEIREAILRAESYFGRVERALKNGDIDAARDLLRSAINELEVEASCE